MHWVFSCTEHCGWRSEEADSLAGCCQSIAEFAAATEGGSNKKKSQKPGVKP